MPLSNLSGHLECKYAKKPCTTEVEDIKKVTQTISVDAAKLTTLLTEL